MSKIIHVVYSEGTEASFNHAINEGFIKGDQVIALYDDLSNGKIDNLNCDNDREIWWKNLYGEEFLEANKSEIIDNFKEFNEEINKINEEDLVYLWYGKCNSEICAMYYTLYLLRGKKVNIYKINVSDKIIESNKDSVFTYIAASPCEIIPEKYEKYFKLAVKVKLEEYENLVNRWRTLTLENSTLRSLINGEIISVSEDYFDKEILKFTCQKYIKSVRVVGDVLGNTEPKISDAFVFWRVKELIKSSLISYEGEFGVMRKMDICISHKGLEYLSTFPEHMKFWQERKADNEKTSRLYMEIKEQGRLEERVKIARNLIGVIDMKIIAKKTGLTIEQVKNLETEAIY